MANGSNLLETRPGNPEHQRLVRGEMELDDYLVDLKDKVDREGGYGKYKGRAEGPVVRAKEFQSKRPSLLRRLGTALIEGYKSYQLPDSEEQSVNRGE